MLSYTLVKECIKALDRRGFEQLLKREGADAEDIIQAAFDCGVMPENIEEAYQGKFDSDKYFAQEMAKQLGNINEHEYWPYTCIDWEFAAEELMYDYCSSNGHYFRQL